MAQLVGHQCEYTAYSLESCVRSCLQWNCADGCRTYMDVVADGYHMLCRLGLITKQNMFHKPMFLYDPMAEIYSCCVILSLEGLNALAVLWLLVIL